MLLKTVSIAAALALATLAAPANASDHGDNIVSHEVVNYSDLDIQRLPGAAKLLVRIRAAARSVCEPAPTFYDLSERRQYQECMANATAQAVAAVGNPLLTSLYAGNNEPISMAVRN